MVTQKPANGECGFCVFMRRACRNYAVHSYWLCLFNHSVLVQINVCDSAYSLIARSMNEIYINMMPFKVNRFRYELALR